MPMPNPKSYNLYILSKDFISGLRDEGHIGLKLFLLSSSISFFLIQYVEGEYLVREDFKKTSGQLEQPGSHVQPTLENFLP